MTTAPKAFQLTSLVCLALALTAAGRAPGRPRAAGDPADRNGRDQVAPDDRNVSRPAAGETTVPAAAATPVEGARRAMLALSAGDAKALRASVWTATDAESEAADVWADLAAGQIQLAAAVRKRFGPDGVEKVTMSRDRPLPPPGLAPAHADALLKNARVKVEGDVAWLTHPKDARHPVELHNTPDGWKIAFSSVVPFRSAQHTQRFVRSNRDVGRVCAKVAAEVAKGAFRTPDEVAEALMQGWGDAEAKKEPPRPEGPPPPPAPSRRPPRGD
jgi:hypothetical protein